MEIAHLSCAAEHGDEFEQRLQSAVNVFLADANVGRVEFFRGVEEPDSFVLNIEWTNVEAHMQFRSSPLFPQWRELIDDLLDGKPSGAHYTAIGQDLE